MTTLARTASFLPLVAAQPSSERFPGDLRRGPGAAQVVRCFIDILRHSLGPGAPREVG